jgi:MFS family permease
MLCVSTWFLKRRGLAMGITVSGSSLGGVCFPIMLSRLFDSVGFGWGVRAAAFLILGCMIVANLLVRSRLPPPGWTKGRQILDFSAFKEPVYCFVVVSSSKEKDADISLHRYSFIGGYSRHLRF